MKRKPTTTIRVPLDLLPELDRLAELQGRSRNNTAVEFLRRAVRAELALHDWRPAEADHRAA